MKLTKKRQILLVGLVLLLILLFASKFLFTHALPSQEAMRIWMEAQGFKGWLVYLLFGTTAVFFIPLNFSFTGLAGPYVYGFWIGFMTNWLCKIMGTFIAFMLGRYFGHKILPLFKEETQKKYSKLADSEKVVLTYIILSFLPFTPSDAIAYFLGASEMRKRTFVAISILASSGTAFSLAYVGSGKAFDNPYVFIGLIAALVLALLGVRAKKKYLGLS